VPEFTLVDENNKIIQTSDRLDVLELEYKLLTGETWAGEGMPKTGRKPKNGRNN